MIQTISMAHANALMDMDLVAGDRIAVWLGDKAEKVSSWGGGVINCPCMWESRSPI